MQYLWNKEIDELKETGYMKNAISITDALIENFYHEILKPEEQRLLTMCFDESPTQEDLDELLKIWDIEVKGAAKSLMLSYLMKRYSYLKFTEYEAPRLKGLLTHTRFANLKIIAHYTKIGKALNAQGIIPMILKGGAMKFLRPDLPRIMGDIDALVPEKDFMKSAEIAVGLGYEYSKVDIHAIDLHEKGQENGILDIHRFIYMETGKEKNWLKGLYKRAQEKVVFNVKTLLPSHEDLLFISLTNLAKNLRNKTSQAGLLYTLFDCKFFIEDKPSFDWNIVKENAKKTGTEFQINFAIKFINKISKNIIPQDILENKLFEKEMNEYSNMVMFKRFYLEDIRTKCREMKIKDVIKTPDLWWKYVTLKPKYQLLKTLRKHPKLIEIFIKDLKTKRYDFTN